MKIKQHILAVDIGASKTNLGIFEADGFPLEPLKTDTLISANYENATELLLNFLGGFSSGVDSACIGVPGPVVDNKAITTNLPWTISGEELERNLSIRHIKLVNDLVATAASVHLLKESDLYPLNRGIRSAKANIAVVAPGTGLGEAFLCGHSDDDRHIPYPSEGGHCDFAPSDSTELELLADLQRKIGHVSYEQVCSGIGLVNIYNFLKESANEPEPAWFIERFDKAVDPSRVIIDVAMAGEKALPLCRKTLEIFVGILGAEAGNMALKFMALGGVYLGGGIPPRILPFLDAKIFMKRFLHKGRMARLLNDVPVQVITNLKAPMLGAAGIAVAAVKP